MFESVNRRTHIDNICSTLSSKISLLRYLSNYVPTDVLKKFYQGYIFPLIDYGSITWSGTSFANIERILKLQKRAARIILHADYSKASSEMFSELCWQPIHKGLVTPANGYVPEGKRTKVCRIWLSQR